MNDYLVCLPNETYEKFLRKRFDDLYSLNYNDGD